MARLTLDQTTDGLNFDHLPFQWLSPDFHLDLIKDEDWSTGYIGVPPS